MVKIQNHYIRKDLKVENTIRTVDKIQNTVIQTCVMYEW